MNSRTAARAVAVLALLTTALGVLAAAARAAPINITPPTVSEAQTPEGSALLATTGFWINTDGARVGFQWDQCTTAAASSCTAFPGATSNPWTLAFAPPRLRYARCRVTETSSAGATSAASAVFTIPTVGRLAHATRPPYSKG